MFKRKVILSLVLCLLLAFFASELFSAGGGGGFGGMGGGMGFDPNAIRQRQEDALRQQIGATEEQWEEMGPIVMKIQDLNQQLAIFQSTRGMGRGRGIGGGTRGGGRGTMGLNTTGSGTIMAAMGGGGMGGFGGGMGGFGGRQSEPTPLSEAVDALRTTLQDTSASAATIKAQLTKVREERKKVEDELKTERDKLAKIVANRPSQEAQLVLLGILK